MTLRIWLLALLPLWTGLALAAPLPCPIEEAFGLIVDVDPSTAEVRITRGKELLRAAGKDRTCVLFSDVVDAGNASVSILLPTGSVLIGPQRDSTVYNAPPAPAASSGRGLAKSLRAVLDRLLEGPLPPSFGAGRGESHCTATSATPLQPLKLLPAGAHTIGSDISKVVIGWSQLIGTYPVSVVAVSGNGERFFEARICGGDLVEIPVPPGLREARGSFTITATDAQRNALRWPVRIAAPEGLPGPPDARGDGWRLGAWRLLGASAPGLGVDGLSRLHAERNSGIAPSLLFNAIVYDRLQATEIRN
jgi:hypothetical protein